MNKSTTVLAALLVGGTVCGVGALTLADDSDQKLDVMNVPIGQERAVAIALQSVPGKIAETELESERGQRIWEIEIVSDDGKWIEVGIDADTGELVSNEADDDWDGNDDDDHRESSEGPQQRG